MDRQYESELEEFIDKLRLVVSSLESEEIPEKVILLIGDTRAGKTTLLYYLMGKKLNYQWNPHEACHQMVPEAVLNNAFIGQNYQSATIYPNIPPLQNDQSVIVIDMPGLHDNRRQSIISMLNIFILNETLKKIKLIHILFVLSIESLDASLQNTLENACSILNESFVSSEKCFSFILTKVRSNREKEEFSDALNDLKSQNTQTLGQLLSNFDHQSIYQFANRAPDAKEGEQLLEQIIRQNKFYSVDHKPENILFENYAKSIISIDHQSQFVNLSEKIITQIINNLSSYADLATTMIQIENKLIFDEITRKTSDQQVLNNRLMEILKEIKFLDQDKRQQKDKIFSKEKYTSRILTKENYQNLLLKYDKISEGAYGTYEIEGLIQNSLLDLSCEQNLTFLTTEFKKYIANIFKNMRLAIATIKSLQMEPINRLIEETGLAIRKKMCKAYFKPIDQVFVSSISQKGFVLEQKASLQRFRRGEKQNASLIEEGAVFTEIKEEIILIPEYKYSKFIASSKIEDTMKSMKPKIQRKEKVIEPNIADPDTNIVVVINAMPNNPKSFEFLIKILKKKQILSIKSRAVKIKLVRKCAQILERYCQHEEAINCCMVIPDQNWMQRLFKEACHYKLLSPEYIKGILIKYFQKVSQNEYMVVRCYNYLGCNYMFTKDECLANEKEMHECLQRMNSKEVEKKPKLSTQAILSWNPIDPIINGYQYLLDEMNDKEEEYKHSLVPELKKWMINTYNPPK